MVSWLLRDRPPDELHRLAFPVVSARGRRLLADPGGKMSLKLAVAAAYAGDQRSDHCPPAA